MTDDTVRAYAYPAGVAVRPASAVAAAVVVAAAAVLPSRPGAEDSAVGRHTGRPGTADITVPSSPPNPGLGSKGNGMSNVGDLAPVTVLWASWRSRSCRRSTRTVAITRMVTRGTPTTMSAALISKVNACLLARRTVRNTHPRGDSPRASQRPCKPPRYASLLYLLSLGHHQTTDDADRRLGIPLALCPHSASWSAAPMADGWSCRCGATVYAPPLGADCSVLHGAAAVR
jgi:hypothetical protein